MLKKKKKPTHRKRDQICGYQRWRVGDGKLDEDSQKGQSSSSKINKYSGYMYNMINIIITTTCYI